MTERAVPPVRISRVGIVAKSHLRAAAPHLVDIAAWLAARGIEAVFETATAALMPPSRRSPTSPTSWRSSTMVDMVVVLGGDGTLLSMADCIARGRRRHSDPRRELRQPRLPDRGHAARALPVARGGARRHGAHRRAHDAARRRRSAHGAALPDARRAERRRHHQGRARRG